MRVHRQYRPRILELDTTMRDIDDMIELATYPLYGLNGAEVALAEATTFPVIDTTVRSGGASTMEAGEPVSVGSFLHEPEVRQPC